MAAGHGECESDGFRRSETRQAQHSSVGGFGGDDTGVGDSDGDEVPRAEEEAEAEAEAAVCSNYR